MVESRRVGDVRRGRESSLTRAKARRRPRQPRLGPDDVLCGFRAGPLASALVVGGRIVLANEAFARAVGADAALLRGRELLEVLPPDGEAAEPGPGETRSYRTSLDGVPARVDLGASTRRRGRAPVVCAVLSPSLAETDTAADRALLALSRELAEGRNEEQLTRALARALEALFPGRSFAIRLVEPKTLALRTLHARGRLRTRMETRIALRRAAIERTALPLGALEEAGVQVTEADEALFEGCDECIAVPLAVAGELFGIVNVEYEPGGPGDRSSDAPLLYRVANHAALGLRNLRSFEELTTLKTYLEGLLEHANALVLVVNRGGEIDVWNAALVAITGFEKEGALGENVFAFVPDEERRHFEDVLSRGFDGQALAGQEVRLRRRDGGEARIAVSTAPILDASGTVGGVIAIGQDLTRIRSLQAAAEHAERLAGIGRLVAGVVHELNNPLTAVNMYSDSLVEKLGAAGHDPADVEKLRAIRESGQRIQRLARDLVAYAKPGARVEPVDMEAVVEEGVRLAKPALKDAGATLEKRLMDVPQVEGSRASLVQVVVNLVRNAAQAVAEGGQVRLALDRTEDGVSVTVEDDGPGMPPDVAARAFEPFFTTRPGVGIGLGLPIVQGIVERHRGSVSLESRPGDGTRVVVRLPARQP